MYGSEVVYKLWLSVVGLKCLFTLVLGKGAPASYAGLTNTVHVSLVHVSLVHVVQKKFSETAIFLSVAYFSLKKTIPSVSECYLSQLLLKQLYR